MLNHAVGLIKTPERFLEQVQYCTHPDETSREEIEFKDGTVLDRYSAPVLGEEEELRKNLDVPGYHRAQTSRARILQLKNYLSSVINSMPAMLAGIDREGRVTHWNRAAEALLGESRPRPRAAGLSMNWRRNSRPGSRPCARNPTGSGDPPRSSYSFCVTESAISSN